MKEFRIVISGTDLVCCSSDEIDTNFCIQVTEGAFPDTEWTDLTLPVLSIWAETLLRNQASENANYILHFMDGPYYLDIEQKNGRLTICGICNRKNRQILFTYNCTWYDFLCEIMGAFVQLKSILIVDEDFIRWVNKDSTLAVIDHYINKIRTL